MLAWSLIIFGGILTWRSKRDGLLWSTRRRMTVAWPARYERAAEAGLKAAVRATASGEAPGGDDKTTEGLRRRLLRRLPLRQPRTSRIRSKRGALHN